MQFVWCIFDNASEFSDCSLSVCFGNDPKAYFILKFLSNKMNLESLNSSGVPEYDITDATALLSFKKNRREIVTGICCLFLSETLPVLLAEYNTWFGRDKT
jgi:hypothetical protein